MERMGFTEKSLSTMFDDQMQPKKLELAGELFKTDSTCSSMNDDLSRRYRRPQRAFDAVLMATDLLKAAWASSKKSDAEKKTLMTEVADEFLARVESSNAQGT